jgi:hypothetical protein
LALRIPESAALNYLLTVCAVDADTVEISLGNKRRTVQLQDLRGAAAARWVALAVTDLLMEEATPSRLPGLPASHPPSSAPRALFLFFPTVGVGTGSSALQTTIGLGSSLRLHRGLRLTFDLGYGSSPPYSDAATQVRFAVLPLRGGPAWRFARWPLEARLSAVVTPYWVSAVSGQRNAQYQGIVAGCEAGLFAYAPLYRRLLGILALGADLFFNRTEFLTDGQPTFATARFTAWLGAGLALRSAR